MTQRFETKIKESLLRLKAGCEKKNREVHKVERQIGRLLAKNSRAAKLFDIKVSKAKSGGAIVEWSKVDGSRSWATLSAGCYLLRTNVSGWSDEELWNPRSLRFKTDRSPTNPVRQTGPESAGKNQFETNVVKENTPKPRKHSAFWPSWGSWVSGEPKASVFRQFAYAYGSPLDQLTLTICA